MSDNRKPEVRYPVVLGQDGNGNYIPLQVDLDGGIQNNTLIASTDKLTGKIGVIRSDHSYIHEGLGFGVNDISDFANGEVKYYSFTTPIDEYVHFKNIQAIDCRAILWENATADETGATTQEVYNRNRIDNSPANTVVKLLDLTPTLNSAKPVRVYQGNYVADTDEVVLLQNHTYVIEVSNISGAQANVFFGAFFYEEGAGTV